MGHITLSKNNILKYLAELDSYLHQPSYIFYEPDKSASLINIIAVQKEASRIMHFLNLHDYTPLVSYVDTKNGEAGNIELNCNSDKAVIINISNEYKYNNAQVLTVLAHEICHKYLYVHNVYFPNDTEHNEILTDLATIYTGLAALTLAGCTKKWETETKNHDGSRTVTKHTQEIGYLSKSDFAFAFYCSIFKFKVDTNYAIAQIDSESRDLVKQYIVKYDFEYAISKDKVKKYITNSQEAESEALKNVILTENIISQIRELVKKSQAINRTNLNDFICYMNGQESNSFNIMNKLVLKEQPINGNQSTLIRLSNKLSAFIESVDGMNYIDGERLNRRLLDLECPVCGYKKDGALKDYRKSLFKCPSCSYLISWDGTDRRSKIIDLDNEYSSNIKSKSEPKFNLDFKSFIHKIYIHSKNNYHWIPLTIISLLILSMIIAFSGKKNEKPSAKDNSSIIEHSKDTASIVSEEDVDTVDLEVQKAVEEQTLYANNQLSNHSTPYSSWYGRNHSYSEEDDYSDITVKTSDNADAVVIVKKNNENGKVLGHLYIRKSSKGTIHVPNGNCQIFFYEGNGWNPNKDMGKVMGGFINNESMSKTDVKYMNNSILSYTLVYNPDGNFVPKKSSVNELF